MSVFINHQTAPIYLQLYGSQARHDEDASVQISVIHCQISSNLFFYTTLLSELSSSSHFANIFYELLVQLNVKLRSKSNRKRLKYLFSSIVHRPNQIYLQVYDQFSRFDEWINRRW